MTAAAFTIRDPVVGAQQINVVDTVKKHDLGFRVRARIEASGIERDFIYGLAAADIAAAGAATYAPATGSITASGGALAGTMPVAILTGQYGFMQVTAD